jgi:hypothetical protein
MVPALHLYSTSVASHTCTKKAILGFFATLILSISAYSQDSAVNNKSEVIRYENHFDSTDYFPYNKKRVRIVAAANIIGYGATMIGLYSIWYKDYPQTKFHTFNDMDEWLQIDKIGHAYSAYAAGKLSMEMWRWTGIDRKKRIWIGGMSGAAYQTSHRGIGWIQ